MLIYAIIIPRWALQVHLAEDNSIVCDVVERDSLPSEIQLLKKGNVKPVNMNKNGSFRSHQVLIILLHTGLCRL